MQDNRNSFQNQKSYQPPTQNNNQHNKPSQQQNHQSSQQNNQQDMNKLMQSYMNNPLSKGPGSDLDPLGRGMLDPFMMGNPQPKKGSNPFGIDDSMLMSQADMYFKIREKNRYERSLKIEKYKNKKRNWAKKISYDCRKRVADTRLRIKGRFISKKDTEKIVKLVDGKQEEAFNEKKNLNWDYITNKFNITGDQEAEQAKAAKPNISKKYLLVKIDEILSNNKNPLPPKNAQNIIALGEKIKLMLE